MSHSVWLLCLPKSLLTGHSLFFSRRPRNPLPTLQGQSLATLTHAASLVTIGKLSRPQFRTISPPRTLGMGRGLGVRYGSCSRLRGRGLRRRGIFGPTVVHPLWPIGTSSRYVFCRWQCGREEIQRGFVGRSDATLRGSQKAYRCRKVCKNEPPSFLSRACLNKKRTLPSVCYVRIVFA